MLLSSVGRVTITIVDVNIIGSSDEDVSMRQTLVVFILMRHKKRIYIQFTLASFILINQL